jgi:citrate synthase
MNIPIQGEEDWSPQTRELVEAVILAHQRSARENQNMSSFSAVNAFCGSGSFRQAVVAAMMTLGQRHGPVDEACRNISQFPYFNAEGKVAGYGNSFFKDGDPAWKQVEEIVMRNLPNTIALIQASNPKPDKLKPNAAMWTAVACIEAGIPEGFGELFFIMARIPVWAELCIKAKSTLQPANQNR